MSEDPVRAALEELRGERRQVERLREEHRTLVESRFYALRMIWLSLQGAFGWGQRRGAYLTWNTGGAAPQSTLPEPAIDEDAVIAAWQTRTASFSAASPTVTVVIPVHNHLEDTLRCLHSIGQTWFESLAVEFIIVDDASTDRSPEVLKAIPGITYLRNDINAGFVRSCNLAAGNANGRYFCFLNNDTIVKNAWLDHLVSTAESDPLIGAVGAKLIYPNGTLQEAGNIVWSNASGWNYGRGGDPADPRYNFERDVDYCSGAALLVRRDLFQAIGGFDEAFAPAYYEDADLCFAVRKAGFRVVYQPKAEVTHVEGVTSGTNVTSGAKRYQEVNRPKFEAKWRTVLQGHFAHSPANVERAARRLVHSPRILFIDSYVPMHDKEAGSNRLMHIISFLRQNGRGVVFFPDNFAALQPYTNELQSLGIEVLYHTESGPAPLDALAGALKNVDYVWICRPELFKKYGPMVRSISSAPLIYDTIDLHFLRKQREAEITGRNVDWQSFEQMELAAARIADLTIVVSETERKVLLGRGIETVEVVPTIHDRAIDKMRTFEATRDLLFIGNYNHTPNADAAAWLCTEIMPRVWKKLPDVNVELLGSNPTEAVRALASKRVRVPGYVSDVSTYFSSARLFVAPLRFGAGMKGKVGQAMSFGLPIVATSTAMEGFAMADGVHCIVADDANSFADAVVRAYNDGSAWQHMSNALLEKSRAFSRSAVGTNVLGVLSRVGVRK